MKKTNTSVLVLIIGLIIIIGLYFILQRPSTSPTTPENATTTGEVASSTEPVVDKTKTVIGQSIEKRNIVAYHYGTGAKEILFVGGVHGGYGWNTALAAYELMDYLKANPNIIPQNLKVTVIPVLNPDGLNKVVGTTEKFAPTDVSTSREIVVAGRLNANKVDINRNFDCDWQPSAVWQKTKVSGGTNVFSEPESQAFKNYIENNNPSAVVAWFSAAGGVFSSQCNDGVLPGTEILAQTFAAASGYKAYDSFDFYETTGDLVNWLAKKNIPAISVVLSTHDDTEWTKNKAGVEALLRYYSK